MSFTTVRKWKCPKCGGDDLTVVVECEAKLIQHGGEEFETDTDHSDHEWSPNSVMNCQNTKCYHSGIADQFEVEEEEEEEEDESEEAVTQEAVNGNDQV